MANPSYHYCCPECGTELELRQRVTLTKRRCPNCGRLITPDEIDGQAQQQRIELDKKSEPGCVETTFGCGCLIVLLCVGLVLWRAF